MAENSYHKHRKKNIPMCLVAGEDVIVYKGEKTKEEL